MPYLEHTRLRPVSIPHSFTNGSWFYRPHIYVPFTNTVTLHWPLFRTNEELLLLSLCSQNKRRNANLYASQSYHLESSVINFGQRWFGEWKYKQKPSGYMCVCVYVPNCGGIIFHWPKRACHKPIEYVACKPNCTNYILHIYTFSTYMCAWLYLGMKHTECAWLCSTAQHIEFTFWLRLTRPRDMCLQKWVMTVGGNWGRNMRPKRNVYTMYTQQFLIPVLVLYDALHLRS